MQAPVVRRVGGRGFTLIELLVVISIIALLVSILLPALSKARAASKSVLCLSQLRQIGLSVHLYTEDYQGFFPLNQRWFFHGDGIADYLNLAEEGPALLPYGERDTVMTCPSTGQMAPAYAQRFRRTYSSNRQLSHDFAVTTYMDRIHRPSEVHFAQDGLASQNANAAGGHTYSPAIYPNADTTREAMAMRHLPHEQNRQAVFMDGRATGVLAEQYQPGGALSNRFHVFWTGR